MSIPEKPSPLQPSTPELPPQHPCPIEFPLHDADAALGHADALALTRGTDADPYPDDGPSCPTCGTPRPRFDPRLSGLLDLTLQTREAASTLVEALEAEVLP